MSKFKIIAQDSIKDEGTKDGEYTIFRFTVVREDMGVNEHSAQVAVYLEHSMVNAADGVEIYDPVRKTWAVSISLDFLGGESAQNIQVRVRADSIAEMNEIFRVSLNPAASVKLYDGKIVAAKIDTGDGTAVAVIKNDDGPLAISNTFYNAEVDRARADGIITAAEKKAIDDAFGAHLTAQEKQKLDQLVKNMRIDDLKAAIEKAASDGELTGEERTSILIAHGDALGDNKTVIELLDEYEKALEESRNSSDEQQHYFVDGRELIFGTSGNDTIQLPNYGVVVLGDLPIGLHNGGASVFGWSGFDVVQVDMSFSPEAVVSQGEGAFLLTNALGALNLLYGVERVEFADYTLALDVAGTAGQVYRLYQAAFDRSPDIVGLSSNIHLVDTKLTLQQMSEAFVVSAEFSANIGQNPTDEQFIIALYNNVLDRDPDPLGFAGWQYALSNGQLTRGDVLIGFSESLENHARIDPTIIAGIVLDPNAMLF